MKILHTFSKMIRIQKTKPERERKSFFFNFFCFEGTKGSWENKTTKDLKIKFEHKELQISQGIGIINMIRIKVKRGCKLKQIDLNSNIQTPTNNKYFRKTKKNISRLQELSQKPRKNQICQISRKKGKAMWRLGYKWIETNSLFQKPRKAKKFTNKPWTQIKKLTLRQEVNPRLTKVFHKDRLETKNL